MGATMSVFTAAELAYLGEQRLGRLATVGADGQPHIAPVTFLYNPDEDTIDIGGMGFGRSKKWRDAQHNPKVCFIVDESWGSGAKALEIRGEAELHETGGNTMNPRFSGFDPQFFRIRPSRIVAWGVDADSFSAAGFTTNSRNV
jgi:pyridoxamine 5'-phosphate oxidase family protein